MDFTPQFEYNWPIAPKSRGSYNECSTHSASFNLLTLKPLYKRFWHSYGLPGFAIDRRHFGPGQYE